MSAPNLAAPSSSNTAASSSPSGAPAQGRPAHFSRGGDHGSHRGNSSRDPSQYNRRGGGPPHVRQEYVPPSAPDYKVIDGPGGRILCLSDIRGNLESLNTLAAENRAQAIIHTGDFGFYEVDSFDRISDRTLRHLVQYSTLIPNQLRTQLLSADSNGPRIGPPSSGFQPGPPPAASCKEMRSQILAHPNSPLLTQFPLLLSGAVKFRVPVYTAWGACEDVRVLEKMRTGEYAIDNLHILDEASTSAIEVGGIRLRLFGLGGALVLHKLFDNGEGAATIAGGQGTMWTTILQIGELVDTAQKCYDQSETRILITHASPGREGLLMQLALALKADLTISAGLHFRYGISYNEFSVQSDTEQFRRKLLQSKASFGEVWDSVRAQVEDEVDDQQRVLLNNGLAVSNRVPSATTATGAVNEEPAWKNMWNWNLPDAAYGHLTLDIREGRISTEMRSVGFSFANRRTVVQTPVASTVPQAVVANNGVPPLPVNANAAATPPTGPARGVAPPTIPLRGSSGIPPAVGTSPASKGPLKSPRRPDRPRPPMPNQQPTSQQQAGNANVDAQPSSRPASAKGPRGGEPKEEKKGNGEVAAPSNGTAKEATPVEANLPASASNQSVKSNKSKSHRNKKSASGWSSKSEAEKSADDGEVKSVAPQEVKTDVAGDEDKREGSGRGGRGRGSGRGRGGGRGAFSRGGGNAGDRRKPSGVGEAATATPKPAPTATES